MMYRDVDAENGSINAITHEGLTKSGERALRSGRPFPRSGVFGAKVIS